MSVTAADVIASIEMILERTPEQALVDYHLGLGFADRIELGRYIRSTEEFERNLAGGVEPQDWQGKAAAAKKRKARLRSFGPRALGLVVDAKHGLFVVDPEDNAVTAALLNMGEYGENELLLAASLLKPDSNVLLVGTHIGAIAVPLSRHCTHMHAVEANPATQRLVEANLHLNGCDNVTLHKIAASDRDEKMLFFVNRENSGGSKRRPLVEEYCYIYDAPAEILVDAKPLDDVCGDVLYDLVFMDIEGSEYFALKGMQRILTSAKILVVEFLPHHIRDVAGVSIDEFVDQIEPHFDWLYIPEKREAFDRTTIRSTLRYMFEQGEGCDGIYFFKDLPTELSVHLDVWSRDLVGGI